MKFKNITYVNKPIGIQEPRAFYVGFSKKWPDAKGLRDRFNIALKEFISKPSNPRKKIFDKYGVPCPKLLFKECK